MTKSVPPKTQLAQELANRQKNKIYTVVSFMLYCSLHFYKEKKALRTCLANIMLG